MATQTELFIKSAESQEKDSQTAPYEEHDRQNIVFPYLAGLPENLYKIFPETQDPC